MIYDIAIIGAGPGGADVAEFAAKEGLSVVLFEKNKLGGVCLNEGCIPTKTLLHSAHLYQHALEGKKYALSAEDVSLDYGKLMSRKKKILKKLGGGIKLALKAHNVEIVEAEAKLQPKDGDLFKVEAGGEVYEAKKVVLATGSEAFVPPIEGLADFDYWTAREALEANELPKSLMVIGAGVIGMEFVSFFSTMGVEVTVVEMLDKVLGAIDREVALEVQKAFEKKGVKFHLSTRVTALKNGKLQAENAEGAFELEAEKILVSVGRRAVTKGLGLEEMGVELNRSAVQTDEYMQTNIQGLYAVGDITGQSMLAHTAAREGIIAVKHILGQAEAMSYRAIPGIVYCDPEVACVGKTEEELQAEGIAYEAKKVPMTMSGRFVIENEMVSGLCKILTDSKGVILGVHIVGNTSSEILVPAVMAVEDGMTIEQLNRYVFPHPTIAEILRSASMH